MVVWKDSLRSSLEIRLECSAKAVVMSWLLFGALYSVITCVLARSLDPIGLWLFWGAPFFFAGWLVIGLPLVAVGDRICHINLFLIAILAGFSGDLLAILLTSVFDFFLTDAPNRVAPWAWSMHDYLFWGIPGFVLSAITAGIYQSILRRSLLKHSAS